VYTGLIHVLVMYSGLLDADVSSSRIAMEYTTYLLYALSIDMAEGRQTDRPTSRGLMVIPRRPPHIHDQVVHEDRRSGSTEG
jgi:hypothetical protein